MSTFDGTFEACVELLRSGVVRRGDARAEVRPGRCVVICDDVIAMGGHVVPRVVETHWGFDREETIEDDPSAFGAAYLLGALASSEAP